MQHIDDRFAGFLASVKPYNYTSQFGEDGIIEAIFARIGETNRWLCECGAGDGLFMSNSRKLIEAGWNALLIEGDPVQADKLEWRYMGKPSVRTYTGMLGLDTGFDRILKAVGEQRGGGNATPQDPDLLICDVDGQDYWLINQMLEYRPRVLMVEYDPNADLDFIPEPNGAGQAGLAAIIKLGCGKLYAPVCRTWCNVIFVRQDLADSLIDGPSNVIAQYEEPQSIKMRVGKNGEVIHCDQCAQPIDPAYLYTGKLREIEGRYCGDCAGVLNRERIIPQVKDHAQGEKQIVKVAAAMSTPRLGFLSNSDCILAALAQFNIPLARGEGAFWHASLTRSIESCLKYKPDYVLTIDYDTAFNSADVAKLVCFLDDNPGIDVVVPMQQKREGGELLASSDGAVDLSQAGIPIRQGHFGLTLFRANVFDRISKPWFFERPGPDGRWDEGRTDADMGFWENCRNHGVRTYLALNVVVGHLELVNTWPDQQLKPYRQTLNDWRGNGQKAPEQAFSRERIMETVEHIRSLEMKD
jgi:hypothetical protein